MTLYPGAIDTQLPTNNSGANTLNLPAGNDHTVQANTANGAIVAIENTVGTTTGTNLFKSFLAGWFPLGLVFNGAGNGTMQTTIDKGTLNNIVMGSQVATGGTFTTPVIVSGTFGTPSIDVITARNSGSAVGFANSMYPSAGTLADSPGGTFAVNAQTNQLYFCALGTNAGNRTLGTPSNPTAWQQLTYAFKTSGSNNGTLVFPSIYRISQDIGTPLLGTGVGWNYFNWRYNGIDTKWDFLGESLNLI